MIVKIGKNEGSLKNDIYIDLRQVQTIAEIESVIHISLIHNKEKILLYPDNDIVLTKLLKMWIEPKNGVTDLSTMEIITKDNYRLAPYTSIIGR